MKKSVEDFGAIGDGSTINTLAIQECINFVHIHGGGVVSISNGEYVSGTLYLKSNVTIDVEASAILKGSPDILDYRNDTHYNRYRNEKDMDKCFIYAQDQTNIALVGSGEINGNAEAFPNSNDNQRPMLIRFLRCSHIRVANLRLIGAAAWTTAFLDSNYIWAENLFIKNVRHYNGDGLNFDGSRSIFVNHCCVDGTDDNLCLQAGSKDFPVENVHISNCQFTSICAGIRIGLKSIGDIRNVVITNCTMKNVYKEGIKIECTEGGNISDISIDNLSMYNVSKPIYILLNNHFERDQPGNSIQLTHIPEIGTLKRIMISNLIATDGPEMIVPRLRFGRDIMGAPWYNGIRVDAEREHPIVDLTFENIRYTSIGGVKVTDIPEYYPEVLDQLKYPGHETSGNYYPNWSRTAFMDIRNVRGLYLSNVIFSVQHFDERPPYLIERCLVDKEEIQVRNLDDTNHL